MRGRAGKDVWPSDLETLCDGVKRAVVSKEGWFSSSGRCLGLWQRGQNLCFERRQRGKEAIQNHGTMYDVVEYGAKTALKIGKGVVKIAGAVAACSTVAEFRLHSVSLPAGNDIASASADIVHVARDEYDEVGKQIT